MVELPAVTIYALAVPLLLGQLPHLPNLPWWLSALALGTVALRVALARAGRRLPNAWLLLGLGACTALAVRAHYGYFLGREPCVAFLVALVGLKFLEARRERDITVMVCLIAFLALTQFFHQQGIVAAILLGLTVLALTVALLFAHKRSGAPAVEARRIVREATTLVLQGIPLALLLFVLFPRVSQPLWGVPSEASARSGLSDTMEPGIISELTLSDEVAFRVDFTGPMPPAPQRYWRGPVLSDFDGYRWRVADLFSRRSESVFGVGPASSYEVTLEPHYQPWLFALDVPASIEGDDLRAVIRRDGQVTSLRPVVTRLRYRMVSWLAGAFPESAAAVRGIERALPRAGNERARSLAADLRRQHGDDAALVAAALRLFREQPFVYTLTPPRLGPDPIDAFLFETRRGFCEHYAGAFVFLMRAAGIPARVVTGYQGGEVNPNGNYLIVRQSDAHAWSEVWIDGRWQRVDPTAMVAPERIEHGALAALGRAAGALEIGPQRLSWLHELTLRWDAVNFFWQRWVVGFNSGQQRRFFSNLGWSDVEPWQIATTLVVFLGAWGMVLIWWLFRRALNADTLSRAWLALCRRAARAGVVKAPQEGPLDYCDRLCLAWPDHASRWRSACAAYVRARYGTQPGRPAARAVRAQLAALPSARTLSRRRRVVPPTALPA